MAYTIIANQGGGTAGGGGGSEPSPSYPNGGFAEFRQAAADAGLHDEGYAGAIETQDNDADAVVDEPGEVREIAAGSTQSPQEVVETFDGVQPPPAADNVPSSQSVDYGGGGGGGGPSVTNAGGGFGSAGLVVAVVVAVVAFVGLGGD